MKKSKLVYIMDPHCGWCYGNNRSMSDLYDLLQNEYDFEIIHDHQAVVEKGNKIIYLSKVILKKLTEPFNNDDEMEKFRR